MPCQGVYAALILLQPMQAAQAWTGTSKNTSYRAEAAVVPHNIYNKLGQPVRAREKDTLGF